MASFSDNAFDTAGFSESAFDFGSSVVVTGGKGDNESRRTIFKPTGLVDRPRTRKQEIVEARVEQSREVEQEIAAEALVQVTPPPAVPLPEVSMMTFAEIDREIRERLHKKLRTEEDELILLALMAAAVA